MDNPIDSKYVYFHITPGMTVNELVNLRLPNGQPVCTKTYTAFDIQRDVADLGAFYLADCQECGEPLTISESAWKGQPLCRGTYCSHSLGED